MEVVESYEHMGLDVACTLDLVFCIVVEEVVMPSRMGNTFWVDMAICVDGPENCTVVLEEMSMGRL